MNLTRTESLRQVVADILRNTPVPDSMRGQYVAHRRDRGADLLDYVEAGERVDDLEQCRDELAQAEASVDELDSDIIELRDELRKAKDEIAKLKAELAEQKQ